MFTPDQQINRKKGGPAGVNAGSTEYL